MKKQYSVDGFIARSKVASNLDDDAMVKHDKNQIKTKTTVKVSGYCQNNLDTVNINDLPSLDLETDRNKQKKVRSSKKFPDKKKSGWFKKILITLMILIIVCLVGAGIYFGRKVFKTVKNTFNGNWTGIFSKVELQKDQAGRTNILIFGTEEDSERGEDQGGYLTDTIMVVSYDHNNKAMKLVSMPRDFWVKYGRACPSGYQGKINVVYMCHSNSGKNEQAGAEALKKKVGEVFGIDIQYYAHVNFKAVIEMIDAVGGVEIVIESEDPRGIYDPASQGMRYPNGPTGLLNGKEALRLIRARNSSGGYGLPNSNFDREIHQQKVIMALVNKLQTKNVLTDVNKVSQIMEIISNNIRTNVKTEEIRSALDIAKDVDMAKIESISLIKNGERVVTTGPVNGQSSVIPRGDRFDYTGIQRYIAKNLKVTDAVSEEQAKIGIYNASSRSGAAAGLRTKLETTGLNVIEIGNADNKANNAEPITIYDLNQSKPATIKKLQAQLDGSKVVLEKPDFVYNLALDIVVVINK